MRRCRSGRQRVGLQTHFAEADVACDRLGERQQRRHRVAGLGTRRNGEMLDEDGSRGLAQIEDAQQAIFAFDHEGCAVGAFPGRWRHLWREQRDGCGIGSGGSAHRSDGKPGS